MMKMQWILISALVFALITAVFAVVNVDPVQVNFMFVNDIHTFDSRHFNIHLIRRSDCRSLRMVRQYKLQRKVKQLEKQLQDALSILLPRTSSYKDQTRTEWSRLLRHTKNNTWCTDSSRVAL